MTLSSAPLVEGVPLLTLITLIPSHLPIYYNTTCPYRPEDTLYVEVSVPVVKPSLVIVSDEGNCSTVDFGRVATGEQCVCVCIECVCVCEWYGYALQAV